MKVSPSLLLAALRRILMAGGVLFFLVIALCWTPYPWRMYHWLSMPDARLEIDPEWIVVLGGGGIPSESGLMRTYYGAQAAERFPDARIMVALPEYDGSKNSSLRRMRGELVLRGVSAERIHLEPRGSNTRAQAVEIRQLVDAHAPTMLVTSPEHIRRSVLTFRRVGFEQVGAYPASDTHADGDMAISEAAIDDKLPLPSLEGSLTLRYRIWTNLGYLTRFSREITAMSYYKMKGWL